MSRTHLHLEHLEDRSVPALIADAVGDFLLPNYTGPQDPGLDVVAHEAVLLEDHVVFFGRMAGSVAATQEIRGVYVIGVDRGLGEARFLRGTPEIGPNVLWDLIVRISPDGTGQVNNLIAGNLMTPLDPADITIEGNEFTARVPLNVLQHMAELPADQWTYNLWPRNGMTPGQNQNVSDLAPDDGNSPVQTIAPAKVASVEVNDGTLQRSMVNSVTVTFDGEVTVDAGAFELSRADGSLVDLSLATSVIDGQTVAVLTFSGADILAGSLADGSYTLTIRGDLVHDRFGRDLDGDADGSAGGDHVASFFRLFGDADGDGQVDLLDRPAFRAAFGHGGGDADYLWYFDHDGDGDVDGADNGRFNRQFGTH